MRKFIFAAIVMIIAAAGAAFYVLSSDPAVIAGPVSVAPATVASAAAIDVSNLDLEAEYAQGRRSFPIISALADKRIAGGDQPAAIKLLEEYVTANPADVQGRKKLAQQYQLTNRRPEYNAQLEAIANAEPTEANLRVLSDIYNSDKDYQKQAEVLKKMLVVTQGNNPQIFADLATIQVVTGDKDAALKTVEELRLKHPNFSSYAITRIMVSVLAEKGEVERAVQIANQWMATPSAPLASPQPVAADGTPAAPLTPAVASDPRPKELADFCNILHYTGHADKAIALVEPHLEMLQREPELVAAYVNANITAGRADHAYAILQKIDEAGKMTPALYPPYLELAIKREDIPAAETIANKMDVSAFNEEQALNILELVRVNNATTVLKTLTARFADAKVLEGKPVLAAVVSILRNAKDQDSKIEVALNTQLSSIQRLRLAETCARSKKTACFDSIVKQFPALDAMSPAQIAEYAQLFIIADRAGELVDPVGAKANLPGAHNDIQFAYHRLAAAAGRLDALKPWLEANANITPITHLQELFYLANDRRKGAVASDIAERLYARDPSPINRDIMTNAFISAGQNEKALVLLREQIKDPGANDFLYLSTLSKVARTNADARKELADYAQASLQSKRGDARQQLNYAYVMINNGRKDAVIPFARVYAAERGGEWKKLLSALTLKPYVAGKYVAPAKLTREQRLTLARGKSISEANKRQIAFSLLSDGYKADAASIFQEIAVNKGPDSQEVKDLMFLWGGKLNPTQLAWVQSRAANASAYDKPRWADLINSTADDTAVLQYVSASPEALYNRNLRQRYFRILGGTGSVQNYDVAMRDWVAQTTDIPALTDYATTAQAFNFQNAATAGYKRILALDPANKKALSQLAIVNYSKGKFAEADKDLSAYLSSPDPDPEANLAQAHFYRGLLLRRQGQKEAAYQEFAKVVELTPTASNTPTYERSRALTAQFHIGQHAQAKAGFNQLLADHPDDKSLLADYMGVLIEYQYLEEATRLANHYDKNSPYYGKGAALNGDSAHVASVERLSDGRELKVSFDRPLAGKSPISLKDTQKLAWLEHSTLGYDSLTVSAKPGYVVRYVPTAQEQFAVVPERAPQYAPDVEAQRLQDLRLQLLYAQIEQQSGQAERAKQRLAALRQYYPNEPQLLLSQASAESASGNADGANDLISQARALLPENEDLANFSRASRQSDSLQFVKLDNEYRNYGSTHEYITTFSGVARVAPSTELGINLKNDYVNPKAIINPANGAITGKNVSRQAGEVFVGHYLGGGQRVQGSLFSNTKTVGAGGYYAFNQPFGRTELLAEYHKTYWDFPEAVYGYATRDRVGLTHYGAITPKISLGLETSLNNYNLEVENNVTKSFLLRASGTYEVQAKTATQPYLGIGLGLDTERLFDKADRRTGVNGLYRPFPLTSREVYVVSGTYADDWRPTTHALLTAGYAYDRLNDSAPFVDARINEDLTDNIQLGVRGHYSRVNSKTDGDGVNLGADIQYKF